MTGWTTGDALAELDRRGFDVKGWSPQMQIDLAFGLQCKALEIKATCAFAEFKYAEGMYHTAKMAELCAFWGEVRPS